MWRLSNLYKIRTKDKGIIFFKPNPLQNKIITDIVGMSPVRHFTLKSRQVGLSTFWILYWLDDCLFNDARVTGILAHKAESIQYLSSIVRIALDGLHPVQIVEDNKTRITFNNNSSILFSLEVRSIALHNLHISEWCLCENERIWATVAATSKWTNITGESTGNGIGNDGYLTYIDAKADKNGYKSRFIPWFDHEEYRMPLNGHLPYRPDKRERLFKLDQEQIHFRQQMMRKLKNAFFVEYPETEEDAFAQSGANFFDNRKIIMLAKEAGNYNEDNTPIEETDLYIRWEEKQHKHIYCLGADVAEGLDGDYSAFKIMCVTCRQEVMRYHGHVGLDTFYKEIDKWARYYHMCLVGVERNNHGHAILLGLDDVLHYPNIYADNEPATRMIRKGSSEVVKRLGWITTANTKPLLCDQFKLAIEGDSEEDENTFQPDFMVRDVRLLDECLTFQRDGVKLGAIAGKHDDLVIASAICYQMYLRCKKVINRGGLQVILIGDQREYKL